MAISSVGAYGRTVLSPPIVKVETTSSSASTTTTSNRSFPAPTIVVSTQIPSPQSSLKIGSSSLSIDNTVFGQARTTTIAVATSQSNTISQSVGLTAVGGLDKGPSQTVSLLDLISPKKKNNQNKKNLIQESNIRQSPSSESLTSAKTTVTCPIIAWGGAALTPVASVALDTTPASTSTSVFPSPPSESRSRSKPKALSEIQQEEEMERLMSNMTVLKGNHNPWFQSRRPRADSLDEVGGESVCVFDQYLRMRA